MKDSVSVLNLAKSAAQLTAVGIAIEEIVLVTGVEPDQGTGGRVLRLVVAHEGTDTRIYVGIPAPEGAAIDLGDDNAVSQFVGGIGFQMKKNGAPPEAIAGFVAAASKWL